MKANYGEYWSNARLMQHAPTFCKMNGWTHKRYHTGVNTIVHTSPTKVMWQLYKCVVAYYDKASGTLTLYSNEYGGGKTITSKNRINSILSDMGLTQYRVVQRNFKWYVLTLEYGKPPIWKPFQCTYYIKVHPPYQPNDADKIALLGRYYRKAFKRYQQWDYLFPKQRYADWNVSWSIKKAEGSLRKLGRAIADENDRSNHFDILATQVLQWIGEEEYIGRSHSQYRDDLVHDNIEPYIVHHLTEAVS